MDAEKPAFRTRRPPILTFSTHYQTGWNVTTPATQNGVTTCLDTFEKERFCSFPHRHGEATGKPERDSRQDTWMQKNQHFVRDFLQFSQLATCQKDKFCSFPHRHGEATRKPETRDETGGSTKTSISCETSSNFHTL